MGWASHKEDDDERRNEAEHYHREGESTRRATRKGPRRELWEVTKVERNVLVGLLVGVRSRTKVKCEVCGAEVRLDRMSKHKRKAHPFATRPTSPNQARQQA